MKYKIILIILIMAANLTACSVPEAAFDGESAYLFAEKQIAFGIRTPGSEGHTQTVNWLQSQLSEFDWDVTIQETSYQYKPIKNIIANREFDDSKPWVIIGAHYDTRFRADMEPEAENRSQPVPGANDGASGVAVLLELARVLPSELDKNISLVFFDAEDQGQIEDWDWIVGSSAYAASLTTLPDAVIIVDMIGDADLNIYYEKNSNAAIQAEIWNIASELGYQDYFIPEYKYSMLDDHTPFLQKGIPAVDIIDFDYPYWHTTEDTLDKISSESLHAVGDTLLHWIIMTEIIRN